MRKNQYIVSGLLFAFVLVLLPLVVFSASSNPYAKINKNTASTMKRKVTLYFNGPENVKKMRVSNSVDFSDVGWETYKKTKIWYLDYGAGTKTVYTEFKDQAGKITSVKDTIILKVPENIEVDFSINNGEDWTDSRNVELSFDYSHGVEGFTISNSSNFSESQTFSILDGVNWILSTKTGNKTVYVKFLDVNGTSQTVSKKIYYEQPERYIKEGSLLKGPDSTVYYLGYSGKVHPFTNSSIYHSWYKDFSGLQYVSNAKLRQYQVGQPVCVKPGTWLVKFKSLSRIYAVEPGCDLRPILSEVEAYLIYGKDWGKRVLELDQFMRSFYDILVYDVSDPDFDIVDDDRDGVDYETEILYGSSDKKADSDSDSLTDYEEIYYWFSDPDIADTDGDGYKDGLEVLAGYSPVGGGGLSSIPKGTYEYPKGSVVKKVNSYYYFDYNNKYKKASSSSIKNNGFANRFVIQSPYSITFSGSSGNLSSKELGVYYPTVWVGDSLIKM